MLAVVQLGTLDYATGLDLQRTLVDLRKQGRIPDTLLLLEHSPVITLGRNAQRSNVIASDDLLARRGVELFECDRGGDVTFHGPGQLVGYPIFDLRGFSPHIGAVEFVRRLEEVLIRACADFGIGAQRVPGMTGVWIAAPEAKIAAIGVHISRGVTSHGFAVNVTTELEYFDLIIPCGIPTKPVTSMAREAAAGRAGSPAAPAMDEVAHSVSRHFGAVFASQILWVDTIDALLGRSVGVPLRTPAELRKLHDDDSSWA
jgi:lipoyl(octanoyl) transferase